MLLSSACAVHCLATPVLIAGLPYLGSSFIQDPATEMMILGVSFLISLAVIFWGYFKYHKNAKILVSIFFGLRFDGYGTFLAWITHRKCLDLFRISPHNFYTFY